ncbi:MAG TPA: hypothetical protein DIS90_15960 [Cytophagales bacterium]|nr:hypothetical protein [Cytophagales bacterium]
MKSILVPTDFSENANTAIEYACELAKSLGAAVFIINVYTPAVTQYNIISPLIEEETGRARKLAKEKLASIQELVQSQYKPLVCNTEFVVGGLLEAIEELVDKDKADLVVMGTRGASGLDKILFGSNTTRVIEKVKCPVLAIPAECPFHTPKRIVYATDFNNAELDHVGKLVIFSKAFNAELMFTHITTDRAALESEELLKRNFAKRVSALTDYSSITYFVKYEDDISRALDSFTTQVDADWIALFTRERKMFEKLYNPSLTKAMAYQTKIPLLAIKA